ncbi:MAG: arsenate reductase (glutaredoxin) [Sulfitobacter sp.]
MITLWHNPRCSKSRETLARIEAAGVPVTLRRYLDDAPTLAELQAASEALALPPSRFIRKGEALYKELGLKDAGEADLLAAMAAHPVLIERPIGFAAGRAVLGRPPENIDALL